jgi:hypothetical protein
MRTPFLRERGNDGSLEKDVPYPSLLREWLFLVEVLYIKTNAREPSRS